MWHVIFSNLASVIEVPKCNTSVDIEIDASFIGESVLKKLV
jgi:hypothetical protein